MKIRMQWRRTPPTRRRSMIRWSRYLLFMIGFLALGYVNFAWLDARLYQAAQSRTFQNELNDLKSSIQNDGPDQSAALPPAEGKSNRATADIFGMATRGDPPLGRIEIGAIGLTAMIQEGTGARTLRRAVGHIPGTALPGERGNVAITGHRDTFFRPLQKIRQDDEITLTTLKGSYLYRVESTEVVRPEDTEVLADSDDAVLTLVTCYPFYYVGPAPMRFIVRAHMIPR